MPTTRIDPLGLNPIVIQGGRVAAQRCIASNACAAGVGGTIALAAICLRSPDLCAAAARELTSDLASLTDRVDEDGVPIPDSAADDLTTTEPESCPTDDGDDSCDQLLKIDTSTCNAISRIRSPEAGAICHASATQRFSECLLGGVGAVRTPLATWNN